MKKQIILLFHLGYWCFYLAMLLIVFLAAQIGHFSPQRLSYFLSVGFSFILLPSLLGFYLAYFFLFKSYLKRRKILVLLTHGLGSNLLIALFCGGVTALIFGKDFMFKNGYDSFFSELFLIFCIGLINGTTGFILKGFIAWYDDLKTKEALQRQTHAMELELIKSKLDPHFLFNTINNIDGMMLKDVQIASDYLDRLSTILRFMLYESKVGKIPLSKELQYIQKYIDLQKIRTSNPDFVNYTVSGTHFQQSIPPMLFIPFIENAFKHVASKKSYHAIAINIVIEKGKIVFYCKNKFNPNAKISKENQGIGNELIEKRLQLLYPNKHKIERTEANETYSIQLTIFTHEN